MTLKSGPEFDVFLSHSHDDQHPAYNLSKWLYRVWPNMRVFMTGRDQHEVQALFPDYFLTAIDDSQCLLVLATPRSLKSEYVLQEAKRASEKNISTIILKTKSVTAEEITKTIEGYGCRRIGKGQIVDAAGAKPHVELAILLNEVFPSTIKSDPVSNLPNFSVTENSPLPYWYKEAQQSRPIPDLEQLEKGVASKQDVIRLLEILEKWHEHIDRSTGIKVWAIPEEDQQSEDLYERVCAVLTFASNQSIEQLLTAFRPLLDANFLVMLDRQYRSFSQADKELRDKIKQIHNSFLRVGSVPPPRKSHRDHYNKGVRLARQKRYEEALQEFEEALKIHPNYPNALCNKGAALESLDRYDEAITAYAAALKLHPNDPVTLFNKGAALALLDRYEEAIKEFIKSLQFRPNHQATINNISYCRSRLKK